MTVFECEDLIRLILSFLISQDDSINIYTNIITDLYKPHTKIKNEIYDIRDLIFLNKSINKCLLKYLSNMNMCIDKIKSYITERSTMPTNYSELPLLSDCQYEETMIYCSHGYINNKEYYEETDDSILKNNLTAYNFLYNYIITYNYKIDKKNKHFNENNIIQLINEHDCTPLDKLYEKIKNYNLTVNFIKQLVHTISNCRNDDGSTYYKVYIYNIGDHKITLVHYEFSSGCDGTSIMLYCNKYPIFFHERIDEDYTYGFGHSKMVRGKSVYNPIIKKQFVRESMINFGFELSKINHNTYYHFVEILLLIIFRKYDLLELPHLIKNVIDNQNDIKNNFIRHLKY
jgi:hypothetical protein